jgi:hypothetical protein
MRHSRHPLPLSARSGSENRSERCLCRRERRAAQTGLSRSGTARRGGGVRASVTVGQPRIGAGHGQRRPAPTPRACTAATGCGERSTTRRAAQLLRVHRRTHPSTAAGIPARPGIAGGTGDASVCGCCCRFPLRSDLRAGDRVPASGGGWLMSMVLEGRSGHSGPVLRVRLVN